MYTATMRYEFRDEAFDEACALWRTTVLAEAKEAKGLVRMQFLTARPVALAIGTWKDKSFAESFMKTGVFRRLMDRIKAMNAVEPKSELWALDSFFEADGD